MSAGDRILNEIIKQGMITVAHPVLPPNESVVLVWASNSVEQLDALAAELNAGIHSLYNECSDRLIAVEESRAQWQQIAIGLAQRLGIVTQRTADAAELERLLKRALKDPVNG